LLEARRTLETTSAHEQADRKTDTRLLQRV